MRYIAKGKLVFLIVAVLCLTMLGQIGVYGITEYPITVNRTVAPNNGVIVTGQATTITYIIQPADISPGLGVNKEVVFVVDTSGSMGWNVDKNASYDAVTNPRRIDPAKEALELFRSKIAESGQGNYKVGLIEYASESAILNELGDPDDPSLISNIQGLQPHTSPTWWTNTGDGIRRGFHMLDKGNEAEKYLIFVADGEANRSSEEEIDGSWTYQTSVGDPALVSASNGRDYAKYWAELLNDGPSNTVNPSTEIHSYFIAFSSDATDLRDIVYVDGDISNERVEGAHFKQAVTASALIDYYTIIADEIISETKIPVTFSDTYDVTFNIAEVLASDVSGIDTSDPTADIVTINGSRVETPIDQWTIEYTLDVEDNMLKADPIIVKIKVTPTESGHFTIGSDSESYISYIDYNDATTVQKFPLINIEAHTVNPPSIFMSQDEDSVDKEFSLRHAGLGNLHFDGPPSIGSEGDYILFNDGWSDGVFGQGQDEWTIRAVLEPRNLSGNQTSHGVANVFLSTGDASIPGNIEIGIDTNYNLLVYMDSEFDGSGTAKTVTLGSHELLEGEQHDIVLTFDRGRLDVALDGNTYSAVDWQQDGKMTLDDATGASFTLGGSMDDPIFFDGKINSIAIYDVAYELEDIYKGTLGHSPLVEWDYKNSSSTIVEDDSGHGHHSTLVSGPYIQGDIGGDLELEYQIIEADPSGDYSGPVSDGWTVIPEGDMELVRNSPGQSRVYARAVLRHDVYGGQPIYSDVVYKDAMLSDSNYYTDILVSAVNEITVGDDVDIHYTLVGSEVTVASGTADELNFGDIDVVIDIPVLDPLGTQTSLSMVELPTGFSLNGENQIIGTVDGVLRKVDRSDSTDKRYIADDITISVKYHDPTTWNILVEPGDAQLEFEDLYGHTISASNALEESIISYPIQPTITSPIGTEISDMPLTYTTDYVDQSNLSDVTITGTGGHHHPIHLLVDDNVSAALSNSYNVSGGLYNSYPLDLVDFRASSAFDPSDMNYHGISVTATTTDYEGDSRSASYEFIKFIFHHYFLIK